MTFAGRKPYGSNEGRFNQPLASRPNRLGPKGLPRAQSAHPDLARFFAGLMEAVKLAIAEKAETGRRRPPATTGLRCLLAVPPSDP